MAAKKHASRSGFRTQVFSAALLPSIILVFLYLILLFLQSYTYINSSLHDFIGWLMWLPPFLCAFLAGYLWSRRHPNGPKAGLWAGAVVMGLAPALIFFFVLLSFAPSLVDQLVNGTPPASCGPHGGTCFGGNPALLSTMIGLSFLLILASLAIGYFTGWVGTQLAVRPFKKRPRR